MTRIWSAAAFVVAAGFVLPAHAAPVPADPVQRCRDLIPMIGKATEEAPTVGKVTPVGDSGCHYNDLLVTISRYQGWMVGSLTIDRIDFKRFYTDRFPLTLSVRAEGIRFTAPALPAANNYQMKLVQKPIEITFDFDYDAAANVLTIRDASFRGQQIGHLTVTAAVRGLNLDKLTADQVPDPAVAAGVALQSLTLEFDNQGMFEGYALLPLLFALPDGETDPEGAVAAAKLQGMAQLAILVAAGVPKESVAAIGRFIQSMPQPRGPFRLSLAPQPPLPLTELAELEPGEVSELAKLTALVKRLNLTASY
ncbi:MULTISPECIES: hypothetical protein [unclassified Inquilinus]|uniref:hypothetical protein n=1 Tax=unclassified Inquilinus TaxID=2645927 RepID=UPI003F8F1B60